MKIRARLLNHGYIDGSYRNGGDIVEIDESKFSDTWMQKLEAVPEPPKKKGLIEKIIGKK